MDEHTQERSVKDIPDEIGARGKRFIHSRYAGSFLAFISFVESVFAPIIIDPFLIAYILARRSAWLRFTAISITFSVLGGIVGYLLGALFYESLARDIILFYGLEAEFAAIAWQLDENGFVFVLLGALTPIPYKIVALASGFVTLDIVTFLIASVVGRTLRLGLVGIATYAAGPTALAVIRRHLHVTAFFLAGVLLAYLVARIVSF